MLSLEGTCNTRSLGGIRTKDNKKIKEKMLYRSDELSLLTPGDWEILREIGIGTICDLRRRDESELYPTSIPEGMDIRKLWWDFDDENLSIMKGLTEKIRAALAPLREMGEEDLNKWIESQYVKYHHGFYMCSKHMKEIILELAKENAKPMIIHCGAGKDRTGYCVAAILTLLDVDQEAILDEYVLTSESYSKKFPSMDHLMPLLSANGLDELPYHVIKKMTFAYRDAMETALNNIASENGSLMEYLKNSMEITDDIILSLKKNLLCDA